MPLLADVVDLLHSWYPPSSADPGDAVGLVAGDPDADVSRVMFAVDPTFGEVAAENMYVIADMSKVDFLASLGIRTLVSACKTLRAKNGGMVLLSPQSNVEQVLRSSGIDTIIAITTTRQEAEATVLA